jgi:hypothetical protein
LTVERLKNKYNLSDVVERKKFFNDIFEILQSLKDNSILNFYLEKLADKTKTSYDQLFKQFKTFLRKKPNFSKTEEKQKNWQPEAKYLLGAIIYD